MKKSIRLLAALAFVFVLMMGFSTIAHASTPSAKAKFSKTQYVTRGRAYDLRFYLNSGSYTSVSGQGRARFDTDMFNTSGTRVEFSRYYYFTGKFYHIVTYVFSSNRYKKNKWYKLRYRTQYRTSIYSSTWYTSTAKYAKFYVR